MEFSKWQGESTIIANGENVTGRFFLVIYNGKKSFASSNMEKVFIPMLKITIDYLPLVGKQGNITFKGEDIKNPFFLIYSNDNGKNVEILNNIEDKNVLYQAIINLTEALEKEHLIAPDEKACDELFKRTM